MLCFYVMDIVVAVIMVTISGSSRVKRLMKDENEASQTTYGLRAETATRYTRPT